MRKVAAAAVQKNSKIELTPAEKKLYALLPRVAGNPVTTEVLANKYFANNIPYHGRIIITGMVRNLVRKGWVGRSERDGPHPIKVWRL